LNELRPENRGCGFSSAIELCNAFLGTGRPEEDERKKYCVSLGGVPKIKIFGVNQSAAR